MDNRDMVFEYTDNLLREYSRKVKEFCLDMTIDSSKELLNYLIMEVFLYDTTHTKCFMRIMSEKIKGMDFESSKKVHAVKFTKVIDKISKVLFSNSKVKTDKRDLEEGKVILGNELREILNTMAKGTKDFSLKDFVELHRVIIRALAEPQFEGSNIPRFVVNMHMKVAEERFIKVFGKHYGMLECSKYK